MGSLHFCVTTITDCRIPRGCAISILSLAVWWAKLEKNNKVRHNMTQIASLLAVVTVLLTCGLHFIVREGWGLIRETKLPMQELELKMHSSLLQRGWYPRLYQPKREIRTMILVRGCYNITSDQVHRLIPSTLLGLFGLKSSMATGHTISRASKFSFLLFSASRPRCLVQQHQKLWVPSR